MISEFGPLPYGHFSLVGGGSEESRQAVCAAAEEMEWFFERWLERTGRFQLTWQEDGQPSKEWSPQEEPLYRATLEIELRGDGGPSKRELEVSGPRTPFEWVEDFDVDQLFLDPSENILRWTPDCMSLWAASQARESIVRGFHPFDSAKPSFGRKSCIGSQRSPA